MRLIASVCVFGLFMFVLGQEEQQDAREVKAAEDDSEWFKGEEKYLKYWTHCKYISEAHFVRISENFASGVQIQSFDILFFGLFFSHQLNLQMWTGGQVFIKRLATCEDPESFARGGLSLTTFFFFLFLMRGEMIQIALKEGYDRHAI